MVNFTVLSPTNGISRFQFDVTRWSFKVFALRKASRGGEGIAAVERWGLNVCPCTFYKISFVVVVVVFKAGL